MNNNQTSQENPEGWQNQGESLNTGSAQPQDTPETIEAQSKTPGGNALNAAAIGRSATDATSHHSAGSLSSTGTNISYEGPTAPGAGGSVGTGEASGQTATGSRISSTDAEDMGIIGKPGDKPE